MEYYRTLHLEKEPFSNSPDPGLFFNSRQHRSALQKLEISIRLRRGLNVITGDVGTGKTTVCRQLIRKISGDPAIRYFLILDPAFSSPSEFLACILHHFSGAPVTDVPDNELALKEMVKNHLFAAGVDQNITTVLMIDEGQKLPLFCLETLRELLNYETNNNKLLQIVIFAQKEFNQMIAGMKNFVDRINFRVTFLPLNFTETRELIRFRIGHSACPDQFGSSRVPKFTFSGFWAVYRVTKGYPRKIINLCHHVLLAMIIQDRQTAGSFFVHACAGEVFPNYQEKTKVSLMPTASVMAAVIIFFLAFHANTLIEMVPLPVRQTVAQWVLSGKGSHQSASVSQASPPVTIKVIENRPLKNDTVSQLPEHQLPSPVVQIETAAKVLPEAKQPPAVDENSAVGPALLGSVKITGDDNLCTMILTIYGSYSRTLLHRVMQDNTGIENPNLIMNGSFISFPVISETAQQWRSDMICLTADSFTQIARAYKKAREYRNQGVDARVLPAWNASKGFMFYVVLNRVFADKQKAHVFTSHLPKSARGFRETKIAALVQDRMIL